MQIIKSPSTMVKKFTIFLIGLFALININNAQVTVILSDGSADQGQTVDVDVTLNNFTDIVLFQYSVNWDETQFSFNSIVNVTTELEQFSAAANIGSPGNGGDPGQLTVSWSKTNTQPESLPANTRLFSIRLNAIGNPCDESDIRLSNSPAVIEFVDSNTNDVGAIANNGTLSINGTNCNGGGGDLTITAPDLTGDSGTNICLPITVTDFTDISSMTLGIGFDPTILSYTTIQNIALPGFSPDGNVNSGNADQGELSLLWFDNTGTTPATVSGTLFELCFDIIGNSGQMSEVSFINPGNTDIEFTVAPNDEPIPFILDNGSVTVTGTGGSDDFTLVSESGTVPAGGVGCVPISVRNFDNIQSMQFALMWDASVLTYSSVGNFNLIELSEANFNPTADNKLRVTWNNLTGGTNVVDNTAIFEVCFEGAGDCDDATSLMFTNDPPISIEVSNGDNDVVPVSFDVGTVTVECGCTIAIQSLSNPTCNGANNGSIFVNLGSGNFSCTWTDGNGNVVQDGANCNLENVGGGTYTLAIDDGAGCQTTREFNLIEPDNIVFGGSKVDEVDGCDGTITLQMIGGTGSFTFLWNDGNTNSMRSALCAGEYCVTATDENGCVANTCFTVGSAGITIVNEDINHVKCFGDSDGSIDITVGGGTGPYTYLWSPGGETTQDLSGLAAGTYSYTITDSSDPVLETTGSYTITQPTEIIITHTVQPSDGSNGSIDVSVSGGTGPYSYVWSPGGQTTQDISGLAPGEYTVLVTDDNNCNVMSQTIVVNSTFITLNLDSDISVACFGDCNGEIDGEISGGSGNYTYTLDGASVGFPVTDLCPGTYEFQVSDDMGVFAIETVTISEPEDLVAILLDQSECVDNNDGFIEISVIGGTGDYDYQWNVSGNTSRLTGLDDGLYSVLVTDENGCQDPVEMIELKPCDTPASCFSSRSVITPNGDDENNEFIISCADDFINILYIYNRWGQEVFKMDNYDNSWIGQSNNGDELPEGGYMWVLEITNGDGSKELKKGTVTILRDQF